MSVCTFTILQCLDCGWVWDDENREHYICACFDRRGRRRSLLLSAGATNTPATMAVRL